MKLAVLSAIASWAARSSEAVQPDLVAFFASGLKEKEALRRAHLRCLRVICENADVVMQVIGHIAMYFTRVLVFMSNFYLGKLF